MTAVPAEPMPANVGAERSLLGQLISWPDLLGDVQWLVHAEDFLRHDHAVLYGALAQLAAAGGAWDMVTLPDQLKRLGLREEQYGGVGYLLDLEGMGVRVLAPSYAREIAEAAARRRAIAAVQDLEARLYSGQTPTGEAIDGAMATLGDAQAQLVGRQRPIVTSGEAIVELRAEAARRREAPGGERVETGLYTVDSELAVLPSDLVVVFGLSSHHKTGFVMHWLEHLTREERNGGPLGCGLITLEQTRTEVMQRLVGLRSGLVYAQHALGTLSWDQEKQWAAAEDTFLRRPLLIADEPRVTIRQVVSRAHAFDRQLRRWGWPGLQVLAIDYLQRLSRVDRRQPLHEAIAEMSIECKTLAQRLGCVVIALAQPNRESADRANPRPQLHDIGGSGQIEKDADAALSVYYHFRVAPRAERPRWYNVLEVERWKQRMGKGRERHYLHIDPATGQIRDETVNEALTREKPPERRGKVAPKPTRGADAATVDEADDD